MTKYRKIIRLKSLNFSERNIALSCSVLLAESQIVKSENLTILGHDCYLLKINLH